MKGWLTAALVVTFLSGGSTGYLVGRTTVPLPVERTWIDGYLQTLEEREGVTGTEDLARARHILETRDEKLRTLKSKVMVLLEDQIRNINREAELEIEGIIGSYRQEER